MKSDRALDVTGQDASTRTRALRLLLLCGILSSVLYVAGEIAASMWWEGYSYVNQAVSELAAVGALTRPFMLTLFSAYNLLVIAFAVGVWMAAGTKRSLRISAGMLVVYAVVGEITQLFSPMNPRGSVMAPNDIGHILLTTVEVLSIVLFIAFGSSARGRGFRIYSIASILVIMGAGILTGVVSQDMTAAASSTPWAGAIERVNIYGTMLWIAMLGVVLLQANVERVLGAADDAVRNGSRALKKVTVLMGSPQRHGATYTASRKFLDALESYGDVQGEIVTLGEYDIHTCRGCKICFDVGEEHCPLKDDRDVLLGKMRESDAVVFASPNYSWHVSGVMKVFLDRIGFVFHRPQFHGKTSTAIVVMGIMRGGQIRKYLEFVAGGLGFTTVKGSVMRTLEPMTEKAVQKMDKTLAEHARRFHDQLLRPARPEPSLFALMMFRMSRSGIERNAPRDKRDYAFYGERGWFESDYYYPTHLGPIKRVMGIAFDWLGANMAVFKVAETAERGQSSTRTAV